jgi:membrane-associated phospholipid phosphatase
LFASKNLDKQKQTKPNMRESLVQYVSQLVSLYELTPLGLALLGATTQSSYLAILAAATASKQLPEKIMKRMIPFPAYLRDRPSSATDCNLINKGGSYAAKPGFPSGHTTTAWFLFIYFVLQVRRDNVRAILPAMISGVFALLVSVARVTLRCHTPVQIYGGIVLGTLWAIAFDQLEQRKLEQIEWYRNDKARVFTWLDGHFSLSLALFDVLYPKAFAVYLPAAVAVMTVLIVYFLA